MIVTMLRQVSGTRDGVDWPAPGESIDVPDDEAESLIGNGLAKAADGEPEPAPVEESRKGSRQATNAPS
jgi:hypothetical protein